MGKPKQFLVHELSDGTHVTAADIAEKVGCSISTARCRLTRSKEVEVVYRSMQVTGSHKTYRLDDGSKWTIPEMVAETGLSKNALTVRLHKSKDPNIVLKPKDSNGSVIQGARISEAIKQSMYFDPLGHWKLLNKCL
jgi:hypothetical protein